MPRRSLSSRCSSRPGRWSATSTFEQFACPVRSVGVLVTASAASLLVIVTELVVTGVGLRDLA